MSSELLGRGLVRPGRPYDSRYFDREGRRGNKIEVGLPPPEQFKIDSREQAAIDLCPVLDTIGEVNGETPAQRIEARRGTWKAPPRQRQRVDKPGSDRFALNARQFRIEKCQVEFGVMNDQRVRPDECEKFIQNGGKQRLPSEKLSGQAMNGESIHRHVALGIDVAVKPASGRDMVNEFDACDLDNAMAFAWIQAGRFGVQNDFTHQFPRRRPRSADRPPRAIRDLPSRKLLTTARSRRKLRLRLEPVGTTKSARSRFSRSGS